MKKLLNKSKKSAENLKPSVDMKRFFEIALLSEISEYEKLINSNKDPETFVKSVLGENF